MSWLGSNLNISDGLSSLSNFTGQISNFTREMLTEGTEEVADPSAELNVARHQIKELNVALDNQKIEYERLKKINDELHERVEASDLQARQVAKDYRHQLMQKEQEVMQLKKELDKQNHDHDSFRSRHDSTDSLDEYDEVKQLKNDIVRLQTECHHWKTLSRSQESQEKLHSEIDQYQHELATLQSTYSQKIANLNKKHKLEMQKWDDEKQGYIRKIEDLHHELNILEEVDNLEGMKSVSTIDDMDALKEELDLARDTITKHRQQLEKAADSFKDKEKQLAKLRKELEESTSELNTTKEQLEKKDEEKKNESHNKMPDIQTLLEQLAERENTLASLSNEINLLKEQLQEKESEIECIGQERDHLQTKENNLRSSLNQIKKELTELKTSTLELMEELEFSHGTEHEQRIEIECLKKVCLVDGDAKDEIIHLKTIISALWERYLATLQLYQKVRHDLHSSNQRLLAQLKARHVMIPSNFSELAESKQEELAYAACQLLLSLIADKERLVELTEKLANNQSIRQQVADVRSKLSNSNSKRQEKALKEKDQLMQKSSELRSQIDEQESVVEDLRADNEQIFQETKELITEIGCQTSNDSIDEGNNMIVALQAEKSVLESTIVGLQNKVQELKEKVRVLKGKPARTDTVSDLDFEDKVLESSDIVETELMESMESIPLNEENYLRKSEKPQIEETSFDERRMEDYERVISQLNEQIEEYRTNIEDFEYIKSDLENDKSALEQVVIDLKTQVKQLREAITEHQQNLATGAEESKALESLQQENNELLSQRFDLIRSLRSLEDEMVSSEILSQDDVNEFENEIERADVLRLYLKDWVIRTRTALREAKEWQDDNESSMSISLEEKSLLEKEYRDAKKAVEELEWDNSLLREQTKDLINQIEAKTTEVELIGAQLEEKCYEVKNFEESKQSMMDLINERDENILEMQESFDYQMLDVSSSKENDIEMLRAEQDGMYHLLEENKKESESYKKANEELMTSFQNNQQAFEDLSMENHSLSEHVRESEMLLRDLRNEKENLLALLVSKEQLVNSLTEESKVLVTQKEDLNETYQEIQAKLHRREKELTEVSHLHFEVEQLSLQAKDSEFSRKSLEDRIGVLSADNERLNTSLEERNLSLGVLGVELKEKRTEFEHLELEMDKLNELVGSNVAMRRNYELQISSLRRKKEELEKQLEEKESAYDTLKLDLREKGAENDLLRLEIAKISKTLKEKEGLLQSQTTSLNVDGSQDAQGQLSRMIRLLQEKDQEIDAMKQKEASLIAAVNQTDQSSHEALDHYIHQITNLTEETNRLMAELELKDEQLLSMSDRLEVLQDQMSGKVQASVVLQGEHSRLLALNESQGNEIAKMRERNDYMLKLLDEKEKSKHDELNRLQNEFMRQIYSLRQEQERLLTLISEKDRQIVALADSATPVMAAQAHSSRSPLGGLWNQGESSNQQDNVSRNNLKEQQISVLEGQLSNMNRNLREKAETNERLQEELHQLRSSSETLKNELNELRNSSSSLGAKENKIQNLEEDIRTLNESLRSRQKDLDLLQESHSNVKEALSLENENLRIEKEEIIHTTNKKVIELQNKLIKALNSLGDCNFSLAEGFEDISKNYSGIIQRIISQRNNVLREKDNEIRTLKNQISSLNVLTHSSDSRDFELKEVLREKEELSGQIMRLQNEKEDLLQEKESIVADLQSQIINLTKVVTEKERTKGHDMGRLSREKERMEKEIEKVRIEKEKSEVVLSKKLNEFEKLSSENSRLLNLLAGEKSNAAKLHTNSEQYKQVLQDKDNRINELSKEKDELTKKGDGLQERISVLQNDLTKASGGQKEARAKSTRELDRLREHLIQVEESYTREALEAEEREKEMRMRLAQAEEQILSNSHSMQDRSRQASQQLDSLQEQLHAVAGQRDQAVMQFSAVQEQAQQYATSLDNLQMVLEQFQREKEAQLSVERDNFKHQIGAARTEVMHMQQRENQLIVQLQNTAIIQQELNRLKQEIATRDEEILQHKTTVTKLEEDLRVSHNVVKEMNNSNDNKVDKTLLRNLLKGYFNTSEGKRAKVVHVVGGLLGFTQEELVKIGTGSTPPSQGGWISSFLPFGGPPQSPTTRNKAMNADKSFSELFVNFLQHESDSTDVALQGRRGNATNPLLSGMSSNTTPLAQPPTELRNPLASSTPISAKRPAPTGVTGSGVTGPAIGTPTPVVPPATLTAHIGNPSLSMGLGGISPIISHVAPSMAGIHVPPRPPMANIINPMNTRPQAFQGTPTSGNPLLVGSMTPVQVLPSITSSGPSSLRNVLFQTESK